MSNRNWKGKVTLNLIISIFVLTFLLYAYFIPIAFAAVDPEGTPIFDTGTTKDDILKDVLRFAGYGTMDSVLTVPIENSSTNVSLGMTFNVTATITCTGGDCYSVTGTVKYNASEDSPGTAISTTVDDKPFWTSDANGVNCGVVNQNEQCQASWIITATGENRPYRINVTFSSNNGLVQTSDTGNATINISGYYIELVSPTPDDGTTLDVGHAYINATLNDSAAATGNKSVFIDFNNSLKLYLSFDNSTYDNSTYGHNATFYQTDGTNETKCADPSVVAGRFGSGCLFDGTADFVVVNNSDYKSNININGSAELTVEAWVKANTVVAGTITELSGNCYKQCIIQKGTTGTFTSVDYSLGIGGSGNKKVGFKTNKAGGGVTLLESLTAINAGQWYHIVGVWNRTHQIIYIDGVIDNSVTTSGSLSSNEHWNITIGRDSEDGSRYFNGTIDEVRVHARALSGEEINASYAAHVFGNVTQANFTSLANGNYTYSVYLVNGSGTSTNGNGWFNSTSPRSVFINATLPNITFVSPTPTNNSFVNSPTINVTANHSLLKINSCTLEWAGTNESMTISDADSRNVYCNVTKTPADGTYTYRVFVEVDSGINITETRTVKIDKTAPNITFIAPTDANNSAWQRTFTYVNMTVNEDLENGTLWIDWNGTNITIDSPELALYLDLDNNTLDRSRYGNNGTYQNGNATVCDPGVDGYFGSGCHFDNNDDTVSVPSTTSIKRSDSFTAEFWVNLKTTDNLGTSRIFVDTSDGGGVGFTIYDILGWCGFIVYTVSGSSEISPSSCWLGDDTWHHYAFIYNATTDGQGILLYRDGSLFTQGGGTFNDYEPGTNALTISAGGGAIGFDGIMDEFRFWNRALSAEEISASYNLYFGKFNNTNFINKTGLSEGRHTYRVYTNDTAGGLNDTGDYLFTVDNTNPTVTYASPNPANGTYGGPGGNYIYVNVTATDTTDVDSCTFEWDGTNETMADNATNGTFYNTGVHCSLNKTGLTEGNYSYYVFVNDTANNLIVSEPRHAYIDLLGPDITITAPPNGTYGGKNSTFTNNNITINVTATDIFSFVDTCTLEWTNQSSQADNHTMNKNAADSNNTYCDVVKTGLEEGNHTFQVYANDTVNNLNVSETRHVYMDFSGPELTFEDPTPVNGSINIDFILVNISATDVHMNIDSCILEWNQTAPAVANVTNYTMTVHGSGKSAYCELNAMDLIDSNYTYRVFVNDSLGNQNASATRHRLIDKIKPNFVLPTINGTIAVDYIFVNASTNGTGTDIDTCNLEFFNTNNNTRNNFTMDTITSGELNTVFCIANMTGLANGNYSFIAYANDTAGNIDASERKHNYVDTIKSNLTFVFPTPAGSDNTDVTINITVDDIQTNLTGTDIDSCTLEWTNESSSTVNFTMTRAARANNTYCYIDISNLNDGNHTFRVFANDTAGNENTSTRTVYIDTILPSVNYTDNTFVNDTYGDNWFYVNVTLNGTTTDIDTCNLDWSGTNQTMTKVYHSDQGAGMYSCFRNMTTLANNNYTYYVWANDTAGNLNLSELRHANIFRQPLSVTLVSPTLLNGTQTVNYVYINITTTAIFDIDRCTLEFNGVNETMTKIGDGPNVYCFFNKTNLANGNHSYYVWVNDTENNVTQSEHRHALVQVISGSVLFSMRFNIDGVTSDSAEVDSLGTGFYNATNINNYYACEHDTSISNTPTFGIGTAGSSILKYINLQSGDSFNMTVSQAIPGNKFIIPVTTGGCGNVRNAYVNTIRPQGEMTRPFVDFAASAENPIEIALTYPNIDIVGDLVKSGAFTITLEKNESQGITQIIVRE